MVNATHHNSEYALRLENLVYQIQGRKILEGLDLEVKPREILAVVGPSGSGKTTILRFLMGLLRPSAGRVWVGEREISQLAERQLLQVRLQMGMVFQNAALFDSLNVAENVGFGLREQGGIEQAEIDELVDRYLEMVGMEGTQERLPAELSGGMRKRVGVARALIMEPRIMLYDEPTAGLDPPTATSLNELIVNLRDRLGVTTVVVSHDIYSLEQVSDRAAMLYGGCIVAKGTVQELAHSDSPEVRNFFVSWKGA